MCKELEIKTESALIGVIQSAVSGGATPEQLEKLYEFQLKWEANEARKAYALDMVLVQQDIPIIAKTLKNTITGSKSAKLENIIIGTKPVYTKYGFSITCYEGEASKPENIRIFADVLHKLGHKETYHYDLPPDKAGLKGHDNKTDVHAKSSSTSYGRRILMCMILNIPTGDDNDGNTIESTIDENKVKILNTLVSDLKLDTSEFYTYMGVEKMEDIPASKFPKAKMALESKRAKK